MLDVLANIAQILGFSLQLYESRLVKYPNGHGHIVVTMEALAHTSRGWKELHTAYHSIHFNIQGLYEITNKYENGQIEPRRVGEISPAALRKFFFSSILPHAVENFASDTRKCVKTVRATLDASNPEFARYISDIRKSDFSSIAEDIEELSEKRADMLVSHEKFCKFLHGIKQFVHLPDWGQEEVEYFLQNRTFLGVNYPNIINNTDKVLMTLLDIFIKLSQVDA